ncbi:hypothetical protein Hanom_Chr13g01225491 [Helianthus anomalus]
MKISGGGVGKRSLKDWEKRNEPENKIRECHCVKLKIMKITRDCSNHTLSTDI